MNLSWQSQLKQALNQQHLDGLPEFSSAAASQFSSVITAETKLMMEEDNPNDPVLAQFLPVDAETTEHPEFVADPVDDAAATQTPGLIHKYHGRVLLIASGVCAVNCRYCFRRHFPYRQSFAPRNQWRASIDYLKQHTDVNEVILSGGDPLTLDTPVLQSLTEQLSDIDHIKTLRIHSRIPVVLPTRIDPEFSAWATPLNLHKVMVLHINHAAELTSAAKQAITRLRDSGFVLLNQSVMLKGVNDDAEVLKALSEDLFATGIMPYYLHQMDRVQNAAHFWVPETTTQQIHQQLQAMLPGYLVPRLVKEVAGEPHKTAINR